MLPPDVSGDLSSRVDRTSTTSEVARRLIGYMRTGEFSRGQRLPSERQLAMDLGVGRSAIREALAALDLLGVIATRQGSGSYFNSFASDLLPQTIEWGLLLGDRHTADLIEARSAIEVAVAKLAAQRSTPESVQELERLLQEMEVSVQLPERLVAADLAFHLQLAAMSENSVLAEVLRSIQSLLRAWISHGLTADDAEAAGTISEHRAVLEAVRAGDADLAWEHMARHMRSAEARLRTSLEATRGALDEPTPG